MALLERLEKVKLSTQAENDKSERPRQPDVYRVIKDRAHQEVIRTLNNRNLKETDEFTIKNVIEEVLELIADDVNRTDRARSRLSCSMT